MARVRRCLLLLAPAGRHDKMFGRERLQAVSMDDRGAASLALRVGVVLPADRMHALCLVFRTCRTASFLMGGWVTCCAGSAEVVVDAGRVRLRSPGFTCEPAAVLGIAPACNVPLEPGAGIKLRDLPTGRGFHWQKCAHFTLPVALEFRVHGDGLLAVNELSLEQYLAGVITAEMSGACPLEFLKSQVLAARAWVLAHTEAKHPGLPIDRCSDDCCQRYQGTTFLTPTAIQAVMATRGQVLLHAGGGIIDANYSKSCGGIIEAPEFVWGVNKPGQHCAVDAPAGSQVSRFLPVTDENLAEYLTGPWLRQADCFCGPNVVPEDQLSRYLGGVDEGGHYFRWSLSYARADLERVLAEKFFGGLERARARRPNRGSARSWTCGPRGAAIPGG